MKNLTAVMCLVTTCILVLAITCHKPASPALGYITEGNQASAVSIDWSLVGQAIAAVISAIAGLSQLFRDFKKQFAGSKLIQDSIQHGGTLTPTAETLGDDLCEYSNQTGSGPAYELAMRVAGEKLLRKYTITLKP